MISFLTKAGKARGRPISDALRVPGTWQAAAKNSAGPSKGRCSGARTGIARSAPIFALLWRPSAGEARVVRAFLFSSKRKLGVCTLRDRTREPVFAAKRAISCAWRNEQPCPDCQNGASQRGFESRGIGAEWFRKVPQRAGDQCCHRRSRVSIEKKRNRVLLSPISTRPARADLATERDSSRAPQDERVISMLGLAPGLFAQETGSGRNRRAATTRLHAAESVTILSCSFTPFWTYKTVGSRLS